MEEYLNLLKNSIVENWEMIFGIIGIIGVIYTICSFYIKHGYKMGYTEETSLPLSIDKKVERDLKILYKNKPIKLLKGKIFRVFNYGDKEIRKEDLYKNRLSVILEEGQILNIQLKCKENNGNIKLRKVNEKKYEILFDYINAEQIVEITVLYEGQNLNIQCQAAGMKELKKFSNVPTISDLATLIFIICVMFLSAFSFYNAEKTSLFKTIATILFLLIDLAAIIAFLHSLFLWFTAPKRKILNYKFTEECISENSRERDLILDAMREYYLCKHNKDYYNIRTIINSKR